MRYSTSTACGAAVLHQDCFFEKDLSARRRPPPVARRPSSVVRRPPPAARFPSPVARRPFPFARRPLLLIVHALQPLPLTPILLIVQRATTPNLSRSGGHKNPKGAAQTESPKETGRFPEAVKPSGAVIGHLRIWYTQDEGERSRKLRTKENAAKVVARRASQKGLKE